MTVPMLMPDVTALLDDPEIGGAVSFQVMRVNTRRSFNAETEQLVENPEPEHFDATGNIQPQTKDVQPSTAEDLLDEGIVVYSTFIFQTGSSQGNTFTGPDEILYDGARWRVTRVQNWKDWGFNIAYATRVRDAVLE